MQAESYPELLRNLMAALQDWVRYVFYDDALHDQIEASLARAVERPRLHIFVKLGAERRDLLAKIIDGELAKIKERGDEFVRMCKRVRRRRSNERLSRKPWKYLDNDVFFPPKAVHAADALMISVYECDELFARIDREFRQDH